MAHFPSFLFIRLGIKTHCTADDVNHCHLIKIHFKHLSFCHWQNCGFKHLFSEREPLETRGFFFFQEISQSKILFMLHYIYYFCTETRRSSLLWIFLDVSFWKFWHREHEYRILNCILLNITSL